jgi:hypothetical protein
MTSIEGKDNQNATKHGGAGAIKRITSGQPFIGIARDAEIQVQAEYEIDGPASLELRNAQRLQAAADLYWDAVSKAAEAGDLQAIDKYIQRYGWLASLALRAWTEIRKRENSRSYLDAGKVLEAVKHGKEDEKESTDL